MFNTCPQSIRNVQTRRHIDSSSIIAHAVNFHIPHERLLKLDVENSIYTDSIDANSVITKRHGFSMSIGNTSFSPPQMLMCLLSIGILLSCSLFRSVLNCDYEVVFFQCHDGCKEALAHFGEVQHALKSTARKTSLRLGLAVPEVDGPALKVKAGSYITFSQLPKKDLWVGDLDGLLCLGWDIAAHPKIAHHSRYVLRMAVRMSTESVLTCPLLLGDGKFPSQLPDGQSYQERIVNDLHVSAATWAL